jgi:hypothetical protein
VSNHEVPPSKLAVYAALCEVVYLPNVAADAEARSLGFHTIRHVGNGGPHAMICEDDHRVVVVVVVRGTECDDIRDLIADGRVLPRRSGFGGWVHRGIEDHASQLWTVLQYVEGTSKELWFATNNASTLSLAQLQRLMKRSDFSTTLRYINYARVMTEHPNVFVPDVLNQNSGSA